MSELTVADPNLLTRPEAERLTEGIREAAKAVASLPTDIDQPLCGPPSDFRRIPFSDFFNMLCDTRINGDADIFKAALANAQWLAAHPGWRKQAQTGNVYFIQAIPSGMVKIGFAVNVENRCAVLQTSTYEELSVIGVLPNRSISDEKALHRQFSASHVRGEWFRPEPELLDYIKENAR